MDIHRRRHETDCLPSHGPVGSQASRFLEDGKTAASPALMDIIQPEKGKTP
jgi:hypothetical protein